MLRRFFIRSLMLAALAAFLPACGSKKNKNDPPAITFISPAAGVVGVSRQPIVYIRFDRALDPSTVNTTNFRFDLAGGPLTGHSVRYNPALYEVEMIPGAALAASTVHQVTIFGSVKSAEGRDIGIDQGFQWTTGAAADIDRPTFGGATGVGTPTSTTIPLTWATATDTTTPGGITYQIFMSTTSMHEDLTNQYQSSSLTTGDTVTGLMPATTYFFIVRAKDAVGNSDTNIVQVSATTAP